MPFYAVAYAHVVRSEKADDVHHAMKLAFGIVDDDRMTVVQLPKVPRSMSQKAVVEMQRKLAVRHFHRTGNILGGWEKEPGIKNVHFTQCTMCKVPITTEPASKGVDDTCCLACQARLDTLTQEVVDKESIASLRRLLGIAEHRSPPM